MNRVNKTLQLHRWGMGKLFVKGLLLLAILSLSLFSTISFGQTYLISDGGTVSTCSGVFYDSGGPGSWSEP